MSPQAEKLLKNSVITSRKEYAMSIAPDQRTDQSPDKTLAAVCGLFCPACAIYLATQAGPESLKNLAQRYGRPVEDVACDGCRSDRRFFHCNEHCAFVACAAERGVDFCGQCADYPCGDLREFQAARPHRLELWANHQRIRDVGYETWYQEMLDHYRCPTCQAINSAYDRVCRSCGAAPSCAYVGQHGEQIEASLRSST
jgi:hypothetical protein